MTHSHLYIQRVCYSLFALLEPIMPENAGMIKYQDLNFKTDLPTKRAGIFSIWGIGSTDYSGSRVTKEVEDWEYDSDREEGDGRTYMGALGVTHKLIIGKRSLLNSSLAVSGNGIIWDIQRMDTEKQLYPYQNIEIGAAILKSYVQRHGLRGGLSAYNSGRKDTALGYAHKVTRIAKLHF